MPHILDDINDTENNVGDTLSLILNYLNLLKNFKISITLDKLSKLTPKTYSALNNFLSSFDS